MNGLYSYIQSDGYEMLLSLIFVTMASLICVLIYLLHNNRCQLKALHEQEKLLRSSEARYKLISQKSNDIIFEYDLRGGYMVHSENLDVLASPFLCQGSLTDNLIQRGIIHPEDADTLRDALKRVMEEQWYAEATMRIKANSGCYLWYQISLACVNDDKDTPWRIVGRARDMDKQKREEERLQEKASRDPLTKMLNKIATRKAIDRLLSGETGQVHAFLIIDVDYFKHINDTRGHSAGDTVLTCAANELKRLFRSSDILGRIGGDEMVVFCNDIKSVEYAQNRAEEVCTMFRTLCGQDGKPLSISCSVGIAMAPCDGTGFNQLYINADLALYAAKEGGRNRYKTYNPSMAVDSLSINER